MNVSECIHDDGVSSRHCHQCLAMSLKHQFQVIFKKKGNKLKHFQKKKKKVCIFQQVSRFHSMLVINSMRHNDVSVMNVFTFCNVNILHCWCLDNETEIIEDIWTMFILVFN